ncbi:hypothetical protein FCM35_KLT00321 [Carex littledalei]|uniref:MATH domain-containing protein n=1 Tax=Carex littledalei TaxID=544730 RepID=A0A833VZC0_9POAL|nr:hypothetical protein FCM35_KLT00321 [Carex littledalei]
MLLRPDSLEIIKGSGRSDKRCSDAAKKSVAAVERHRHCRRASPSLPSRVTVAAVAAVAADRTMANDEQSEADMICRMETFTKSFSLKIIGYSLIKKVKPNGMMVGTFDLGGHTWAITFFPYVGYHSEWLALQVSLLTETKTVITLEVEYSLFDHVIGAYSAVKSEGNFLKQGDTIIQVSLLVWEFGNAF